MVHRVKTSGKEDQRMITSDKEWYNEWQRVVQRVTTSEDKVWQRMTASGTTNENEWEQVKYSDFNPLIPGGNSSLSMCNLFVTTRHWRVKFQNDTKGQSGCIIQFFMQYTTTLYSAI